VNEHEISRLRDLLQLQALTATHCETVDACVNEGAAAAARFGELFMNLPRPPNCSDNTSMMSGEHPRVALISVRFIQEG
jgi:hypothetical protein